MQVPSVPGQSLVRELAGEGGLTPLHLAAYSGSENVVRGLLNSLIDVSQPHYSKKYRLKLTNC